MSEFKHDSTFASPDDAESAFYEAFANCDIKAMGAVWANAEVICVHPGSSALVGREIVMRSWVNILSQAEPPDLHIKVLNRVERNGLSVHFVEEHLKPTSNTDEVAAVVLATNVYCLEKDGWRLLEHHASVAAPTKQTTH